MVDFKKIVYENKDKIVGDLVKLLQIPSVMDDSNGTEEAPFGKEVRQALDFMMDLAKKDGFETYQHGGYVGDLTYGNKGNKLVYVIGHLDVMPEGDGWNYPPFEAKIVDGKIYARGSQDDKGPLMAAYYALKFIKDAGIHLKNEVKIIFGTDEENNWRCVKDYLSNHPIPDMGFSPDASFPLIYGEKGRMAYDLSSNPLSDDDIVISIKGGRSYNAVIERAKAVVRRNIVDEFIAYCYENDLEHYEDKVDNGYELTIVGKAAHAMEPQVGVNAGTYMCDFLSKYSNHPMIKYVASYHHLSFFCEKIGLDYYDYEMGPITCNIGIMDINSSNVRVTLDLRYPTRMNAEEFNQKYTKLANDSNIVITNFSCKAPHYVDPNSELVQKLYASYVKITGDSEHKPFTIGGGTYASALKNAVAFGMTFPDEAELCHQANECLSIESLLKSTLIYIDAILSLGEADA